MRLVQLSVKGFRGYRDKVVFDIEPNLTALVGQNDAGKSTALTALDFFFNSKKMMASDYSVNSDGIAEIECAFSDLPRQIVIDSSHETTLADEHLLDAEGMLRIRKRWVGLTAPKVYIVGNHPLVNGRSILNCTISELKKIHGGPLDDINGDNRVSSEYRKAIWVNGLQDGTLEISEATEIELVKESGKRINEQLASRLPLFYLFASDTPASDTDALAQDPIRLAVDSVLESHAEELDRLKEKVTEEIGDLLTSVAKHLGRLAPTVAGDLTPNVGDPKWGKAFGSSTLLDDNQVPVQNRGSGVRRLILMSFFRAQADQESTIFESDLTDDSGGQARGRGVIIALEEPETALHPDLQRELVNSLNVMAAEPNQQVLITTHSSNLLQHVPVTAVRYIERRGMDRCVAVASDEADQEFVVRLQRALGIFSDHAVKCFILVEGANDIDSLHKFTAQLAQSGPVEVPSGPVEVVDFGAAEAAGVLKILPIGGCGATALWAQRLREFKRNTYLLLDSDRTERGGSPGDAAKKILKGDTVADFDPVVLTRREMENYLNVDAILGALPSQDGEKVMDAVREALEALTDEEWDFADLPTIVAEARHSAGSSLKAWDNLTDKIRKDRSSRVKKYLVNSFGITSCHKDSLDDDLRDFVAKVSGVLGG